MQTLKQSWWSSSERHHIYSRWCLLVLINAAYPFLLSLTIINTPSQFIGVGLAIISFIIIYAETDSWLLQKQYQKLSKQLKISASLKIATFILPFIDIFTGMVAIGTTEIITGISIEKSRHYMHELEAIKTSYLNLEEMTTSYMVTMTDGLLLSLIVALVLGLIRFINNMYHKQKQP